MRKHTLASVAASPVAVSALLPCGCAAYGADGRPSTAHVATCKMNRVDRGSTIRQRPAVVAMFTQLNELWYLSHDAHTAPPAAVS